MRSKSYSLIISTANSLAANYFKDFRLRDFIETVLTPVDYTRTREVPVLIDVSGILNKRGERLKILDIGSPQILSLSLCKYSELWDVVYINPYQAEIEDLRKRSKALGTKNLKMGEADITDLKTLKGLGKFDHIFSCSVFEHIHPEDGGDVTASRNIKPLLKPGGVFTFSVPYYKKSFNEYVEGNAYAVKGTHGEKIFFQRFYDEQVLYKQIIEPSCLGILDKKYIGERFYQSENIHKRMAFVVGFGKRSLLLGRFFRILSDIFMEESRDYLSLRKPYLAIYSLNRIIESGAC